MPPSSEFIVISVGGSIVVPDAIDVPFLRAFREIILQEVEKGRRFVLIIGGGKTCRNYQNAASELSPLTNVDRDWIGIYSTHFNAHFMRYVFKGLAHDAILTDPAHFPATDKAIIIGAGHEPGASTDIDAIAVAAQAGAKTVINLSNIDYVYDSDPKKNPNAKRITQASWKEYLDIIPREWVSGMNTPFDPVAAQKAEELGITVAIMNGRKTENFARYLNGQSFEGTVIL